MSDEHVLAARKALDAWNRHDANSLGGWVTPDIEFVPVVAVAVEGGPIRGPEEMARFQSTMDETHQPTASVFWFRDGKISRIQSFLDIEAAIGAASGEGS